MKPTPEQLAKLPKKCGFDLAWRGPCGKEDCKEHSELRCVSCDLPATHQCDETMGPCICGADLCDNCEHELDELGTSGAFRHCAVGAQKYLPWYLQKDSQP